MEKKRKDEENEIINDILYEVRESVDKNTNTNEKFKHLPDGRYEARVYISVKTIKTVTSPNNGRRKFEIQLAVTKGEYQGQMAYNHRVIVPHYLANIPSDKTSAEYKKWRGDIKNYFRQTDIIMSNCGVDISERDMDIFVKRIAENNRRKTIVNFTMKKKVAYINYPLDQAADNSKALLKEIEDQEEIPLG